MLSPIGIGLAAAGVSLMLLGVVVAAPYASLRGPYLEEWWMALGLTTLVCLAGFTAELFLPLVGGILLTVGGVAALVVLGLSTPPQPDQG